MKERAEYQKNTVMMSMVALVAALPPIVSTASLLKLMHVDSDGCSAGIGIIASFVYEAAMPLYIIPVGSACCAHNGGTNPNRTLQWSLSV